MPDRRDVEPTEWEDIEDKAIALHNDIAAWADQVRDPGPGTLPSLTFPMASPADSGRNGNRCDELPMQPEAIGPNGVDADGS